MPLVVSESDAMPHGDANEAHGVNSFQIAHMGTEKTHMANSACKSCCDDPHGDGSDAHGVLGAKRRTYGSSKA